MSFTWKTEMRELLGAEGREDQLRGQAAAGRLEGGRWQLHTMSDAGTFGTDAVISDADARALAHAILDADRHDMEAPSLTRVEIIDVAEHARVIYGESADQIAGRRMPEHDYRFHVSHDQHTGALWTVGADATATDIMTTLTCDLELKAKGL